MVPIIKIKNYNDNELCRIAYRGVAPVLRGAAGRILHLLHRRQVQYILRPNKVLYVQEVLSIFK